MDGQSHKDLKDRTMQFALAGVRLYQQLPNKVDAQVCGRQFMRAVTSVGANTRAAFRGRSLREFKAKLGVVVEEADECGYWLDLMETAGIIDQTASAALRKESDALVSIFTAMAKR